MRNIDEQPKNAQTEPAPSGNRFRNFDELYRLIFSCLAVLFLARLLVGAIS